jgi:hypothetical protein
VLGSEVLDTAISQDVGETAEGWGRDILTVSVLSILLTAPVGALFISFAGRRWLHKTEVGNVIVAP